MHTSISHIFYHLECDIKRVDDLDKFLHNLITDFDTICNSLSLPLIDIIQLGRLRIVISPTVLKHIG